MDTDGIRLLKTDIELLPTIISVYREELANLATHLEYRDKPISAAIVEQSGFYSYYESRRAEIKATLAYIEMLEDQIVGGLWKRYNEKSSLSLTQKDKEHYMKQDAAYIDIRTKVLSVRCIYDQYCSAVDMFKQRGYDITNLTKLMIASKDNDIV